VRGKVFLCLLEIQIQFMSDPWQRGHPYRTDVSISLWLHTIYRNKLKELVAISHGRNNNPPSDGCPSKGTGTVSMRGYEIRVVPEWPSAKMGDTCRKFPNRWRTNFFLRRILRTDGIVKCHESRSKRRTNKIVRELECRPQVGIAP
jgi:hypothetical protein